MCLTIQYLVYMAALSVRRVIVTLQRFNYLSINNTSVRLEMSKPTVAGVLSKILRD